MPKSKRNKKPTRAEIIAAEKKKLAKTMTTSGYNSMKAKHGKTRPLDFPDYKDCRRDLAPLSNTIGNGFVKRTGAHHPDAVQFPVGNSHKQGLELVYNKDYLSQMNGKKT